MSTIGTTAGDVMGGSAALLNDTEQQIFTNTDQIPYLNIAMRELQEYFELNNVPVTNNTSAVLAVDAETTDIGFATNPALPSDLIEIQQAWNRARNQDPWIPMTRQDFIPHYLEDQETPYPIWWEFNNNIFKILACNADIDIKLDYIKTIFSTVTSANDILAVVNCQSFLTYRTAGLCAEFIGENKTRADSLNADALLALDRTLGINAKGQQSIFTRRRPFRVSYKMRGGIY